MPDIRSFFGPKGGAAQAKPAVSKKEEDTAAKKGRGRARKVVEESDDDNVVEVKNSAKTTPKKTKGASQPVEGVEISASDYFASTKSNQKPKTQTTPAKAAPKSLPKTEVEIRVSPRKKENVASASEPVKNGRSATATEPPAKKKRSTAAYKSYDLDDDEDAYNDDEDGGDDIFAADGKRGKRKNDDYVEEDDSEEDDFAPKPKRVASRSAKAAITIDSDEDDFEPAPKKGKTASAKSSNAAGSRTPSAVSKKRKTPESESDVDLSPVTKPRKKAATTATTTAASKPKTPAASTPKKAAATKAAASGATSNSSVQAILDSIPLIQPPSPPPKDGNAPKFNWRKAAAGGGNSGAPPNAGAVEIPEGEPNCLAGQTFVFTGLLKTISRDEGQALVKRYGGKVMSAPSKNTGWIVLGDDAGPSKLAKIQQFGIRTIDETGLFEMIKRLPAGGGDSKEAEKAREKQDKELEKIRLAAEEMNREEESKRLAAERAEKAAAKAAAKAPAANGKTGSAQAAARPPPAAKPAHPASSQQLWTTKYAPTQLTHICGNKAQVERIAAWLKNWPKAKKYDFKIKGADGLGNSRAIIISGPPGIGKTTAAHLAAKLADHDIIENNASDTRSKKMVENGIGDAMDNTSLMGFFAADGKKVSTEKKNIVLIMDEVDGMSAGDRGGIAALAKFCRKTEVPLILICNERRLPKMRPFDNVAFDIRFNRPTVDQIRSRIMTICLREGLKMPTQVVDALIEGTGKDIRQIINMLSTAKLDQTTMSYDDGKAMTKAWEKHVVLKPWDICQKLLGGGLFAPASKATLNDKIELYFNDHEFSFLMIQENYLSTRPQALTNSTPRSKREANLKYLELVDNAAESISDGDLVDRMIHGPQQQWSLMPTHAVFSSVRPASFIAGQLTHSGFTSWLGNNSKTGKFGRLLREIHSHMRLKASGDHNEIRQQYLPVLWYQLIKQLENEGKDAIDGVIELMDNYYLTRDDVDAIRELGLGYMSEDTVNIDSQTKAAFTRTYNGMAHPVPFMKATTATVAKKTARDAPDLEEAIEEDDDGDVVAEPVDEEDEELDLKKDKYIKQPKAKAKRAAPKKKAAKDDGLDEEEEEAPKARGKGKATAPKKTGRGKK
ncbi:replication factor C subunit 1 [Sporothrix schenckii 1099-18]|uniref:Replication factor C subunit 1 n=1 Tax=Sporothrix schenckii 1099-18 TaxID=1397361 RepID=A0A0F2MBS1_SPOSC|nr:replication factor C subunit 1 [Sporothrix schenckii 1099-18]KJR87082.1 replication factor C subunit 1 [Sporothrix schenckii 1099-18]